MPNFNESSNGFKLSGNPFQKNFPGAFKQAPEMTEEEIEANIQRAKADFDEGAEVLGKTNMYEEMSLNMRKSNSPEDSELYVRKLENIASQTGNPKHVEQFKTARDAYNATWGGKQQLSGGGTVNRDFHARTWHKDMNTSDVSDEQRRIRETSFVPDFDNP
tara:strand:+ start:88 stop:570 length:483 start_codon:yes stop_codon:yes gene_type:complete